MMLACAHFVRTSDSKNTGMRQLLPAWRSASRNLSVPEDLVGILMLPKSNSFIPNIKHFFGSATHQPCI